MNVAAFPFINLTGNTQFRLAFTLGDDDDLSLDTIMFSSGNDSADQPQLIVYDYVP